MSVNFNIDVSVVTYNSSKWIDGFFSAFSKIKNFDLKRIHIYFKDNGSADDTIKRLNEYKNKAELGGVYICEGSDNRGFGAGSNAAAREGNSEYILFLNIDTEICEDAFCELEKAILSSEKDVAVWEMRQFPYEHPKIYNPATLETSWVSGACFVLRRDVFNETGGFDEDIFMYGEDVDMSWRIRAAGYKLLYIPKSSVYHFSYSKAGEVKPVQFFGSIKANLLLRWRFGNASDVLEGYLRLISLLKAKLPFDDAKKRLKEICFDTLKKGRKFKNKYRVKRKVSQFFGWDYEFARSGAFYENTPYGKEKTPLVSVIVRTCGRPEVLYECLKSIENQTYSNIEVCVVEDGKNVSESFIRENFPNLNVKYRATVDKLGRSYAGNMALSMAEGEYLNFLDDDDMFYCDHVETMVNEALKKPEEAMFYAKTFETPIKVLSKKPYEYTVYGYKEPAFPSYSKMNLVARNLFPIQSVFLKKEIFDKLGGFNTSYEYLEDWDLWLKYSTVSDYVCVDKLTSLYRVPAKIKNAKERRKLLKENESEIRAKYADIKESTEICNCKELINTSKLKYNFDSVTFSADKVLQVSGWCFVNHRKNSSIKLCVTDSGKKQYYFDVDRYERQDVNAAYPNDCIEPKCGVVAVVFLNGLNIKKIESVEMICIEDGCVIKNPVLACRYVSSGLVSKVINKLHSKFFSGFLKVVTRFLNSAERIYYPDEWGITSEYTCSIDSVIKDGAICRLEKLKVYAKRMIEVSGWGFIYGISSDETDIVLSVTDKKGTTCCFKLDSVIRKDVACHFNEEKYTFSGFNAGFFVDDYKMCGVKDVKLYLVHNGDVYEPHNKENILTKIADKLIKIK